MATDLKMWVGKEFYTLGSYIAEALTRGVSKRIPSTMIPEVTPGKTRLFLVYPEALVLLDKENYAMLEWELFMTGMIGEEDLSLQGITEPITPDEDVPLLPGFIQLRIALEVLEKTDPKDYRRVIDLFGVTYKPGIFGYTYLTGIQYVTRPGEEGLPPEYQHLEGLVEPVRVLPKE